MIVALAQIQPKYGDIAYNLASQETFIRQASASGADMIVFPELSITGYEPSLAQALATDPNDPRFQMFQELTDQLNITVITSSPLRTTHGITISLLIYQAGTPVQVYSKQFLHSDEAAVFVPEKHAYSLEMEANIGLAICYELSVEEHIGSYLDKGLDIYLTSAAKTAKGCEAAHKRLAALAKKYEIMTLFVNSIGPCDGVISHGRSAAWNARGEKLEELSTDTEGLLLINTEKQSVHQAMHI